MEQYCKFYKDPHEYWLGYDKDDEFVKVKQLISITQLLSKHGLSPDYGAIDKEVLHKKAERGTYIHEELENYIKNGEIGFTDELFQFIDICKEQNIKPLKSEFMVYNDLVAGTLDTAGMIGELSYLGDYKTTSALHLISVAWQLSLGEYLDGKHYDKLLAFWFNNGNCKIVELQRIPVEEIEKLLESEKNGILYKQPTLELDIKTRDELLVIQNTLNELDNQKKELEEKSKAIKQFILEKMEEEELKK